MLTPTSQGHTSTVNLAQLTDDAKTCYIAQPFGYANYALVNQMPIGQSNNASTVAGIATVDSNGRIQVVNKPITNTISNISFKCDVCGLMFSHLTLLNHHKRIHTQDGTDATNEQITVVTQQAGQNLVQMEHQVQGDHQQHQQQQHHQQQQQQHHQQQHHQQHHTQQQHHAQQHHQQPQHQTHIKVDKSIKCITCGGPVQQNPKRKGPKLIRCESCISNDASSIMTQQRQTQIFVAPDGDVKFEMNPDAMDVINAQNLVGINQAGTSQHQHGLKQPKIEQNAGTSQAGYYPVKKRNMAAVTKCHKCNGSGVIFIGGHKNSKVPPQEKPFHCNICGGSFSRYSSLWSHKKLHSGEKNYKCSICGLAFAKAVYLKNHSRIHTGEKPYKCQTCGMQFSQSPHLKNHERTHSGEKPYVCEVCDKGFARHATLWNHRRIHTGEKPYKCDTCGSAFSQAAHLKNHAKVHSGEKPFKCEICTAAFADRFALKRHRRIHEKYGQTAPRQPAVNPDEQMIVHKEEILDPEDNDENQQVVLAGI